MLMKLAQNVFSNKIEVKFGTGSYLKCFTLCFFQHEIGLCRKEQPFEIRPNRMDSSMDFQPDSPPLAMETDTVSVSEDAEKSQGSQESTSAREEPEPSTSSQKPLPDYSAAKTGWS